MQIEYLSESMILMRAIDNRAAPVLATECAEPRRSLGLFVVVNARGDRGMVQVLTLFAQTLLVQMHGKQ